MHAAQALRVALTSNNHISLCTEILTQGLRSMLGGLCRAERASHIDVALPYELRALEGALHVAVSALEADTLQLEHSIGASLDNLDRRVRRLRMQQSLIFFHPIAPPTPPPHHQSECSCLHTGTWTCKCNAPACNLLTIKTKQLLLELCRCIRSTTLTLCYPNKKRRAEVRANNWFMC